MTFKKDYMTEAGDAYQRALDPTSGGIATGNGDQAQAAQIAALLAIAQRLDAILEHLRTTRSSPAP